MPPASRINNYIGKSNWPDALFKGYIDELRIYDRALSAREIYLIFFNDPIYLTS